MGSVQKATVAANMVEAVVVLQAGRRTVTEVVMAKKRWRWDMREGLLG